MTYFVIFCDDDGITVTVYEKEELEKLLEVSEFDPGVLGITDELGVREFIDLKKLDDVAELTCKEGVALVIKGECVVPKPQKVVTKFVLD